MIFGYMHVYQVNNWKDIMDHQLDRMKKSGLYDRIDKLYVGLLGKTATRKFGKKVEIIYHINLPELEQSFTLTHLHLKAHTFNGQIFYVHTKGVSHNTEMEHEAQKNWRELMEHYVIDRWKICRDELAKNDIVGTNWHFGEGHMNAKAKNCGGIPVTPHFSGNMWWATTDYIKTLPILFPLKSKYQCEFWIGKGDPKVSELWRTGIHHHRNVYPESEYIGKIKTQYYRGVNGRQIGIQKQGVPLKMSELDSENKRKTTMMELENLILDLGCDHIPTFGGKYEGGIHLQQVADEIAPCIYDLKKYNHKFRNFLEIGAAAGGNTYLFNHFFDFENITIIDNNKHPKHGLRKEILKDINYDEWIGDSHTELAVSYLRSINRNYDVVFIDGDHGYGGVLKDYTMIRDFLNYKGFIIFHDTYVCKDVKEFVDNLKKGAKMFQDHTTEIFPIKLFGDYVGKKEKLGITVFQIYSIPKWRDGK